MNATSTVNASGSRGSSAARQRALVHIPCAIADGKPNSRALSGWTWIGFSRPRPSRTAARGRPAASRLRSPGRSPADGRSAPGSIRRRPHRRAATATATAATATLQVRRDLLPDELLADPDLGAQRELLAARMVLERRRPHLDVELVADADRPVLGDPVGDVHEPDRSKREARVGHQRQLERKREDVRVRRRHGVAKAEPAHAVVRRHPGAVDPDVGQPQRQVRDLAAAAADERQQSTRPGSSPRRRARTARSSRASWSAHASPFMPPRGSGRRPGPRSR